MSTPTFGTAPEAFSLTSVLSSANVIEGVVIAETPHRLPVMLAGAYTKARQDLLDQMLTAGKEPLSDSAYRVRIIVEVDVKESL